jgi:hypothetical protein
VIDVARERHIVEPSTAKVFRVHWFRVERPVAGTTYCRQPVAESGHASNTRTLHRTEATGSAARLSMGLA